MNLKKTIIFILLSLIWSWIFWFIGLNYLSEGINQESIEKFIPVFFIGVYGPTFAAIATTLFYDGISGLISLLKKLLIWKFSFKYYLYLILLPIVFVAIGIGIYSAFVGPIGIFDKTSFLIIPITLISGIYAGPLGEELGWRGFLLPEFQKSFSNLKSAIIIGVIWFIWHVPLFWAPFGTLITEGEISIVPFLTYFVMLICLSIIITWLVIKSKGSVLIAILFHLSINAGIALLFYPELTPDFKTVHFLSSIPMVLFSIYLILTNKLVDDS